MTAKMVVLGTSRKQLMSTLKAAVIFNSSDKTIHIIEVDESFDATLSDVVDQWLSKSSSSAALP
ncbi:BPK_collapsed_G0003760.mRNA.1.CDS.1 [Saccharomyces cerevisiae]|nr:BPK_collapsed_G0003760.mRNA.1.CDS.1 [Saccharomyces cerevisiae]